MKRKIFIYLFIISVTLTGCNRNKNLIVNNEVYSYNSENKKGVSFLDFDNAYEMSKNFTLDYYNSKMSNKESDFSKYFTNVKLVDFTNLLIKKEGSMNLQNIDFGLYNFELINDNEIFLQIVVRVGDESSSYSQNIDFLIINKMGDLKIADWLIPEDMYGYNNSDIRGIDDTKNIFIWDDEEYANKMINKLNKIN